MYIMLNIHGLYLFISKFIVVTRQIIMFHPRKKEIIKCLSLATYLVLQVTTNGYNH